MTVTIRTADGRREIDKGVIGVVTHTNGAVECFFKSATWTRISTVYKAGAVIEKVEE